MRDIKILDCTLRDGGYVNENNFGYENIIKIKKALEKVGIDIIECGYIMDDKTIYDKDVTEYKTFEDFKEEQQVVYDGSNIYSLMLLGEKYKIENLPESDDERNLIRMTFHKHSLDKAVEYAKIIQAKGYNLFVQPTVTMSYNEQEIIDMLKVLNKEVNPYGVAIVDTFGQMNPEDVMFLTSLFDKHLNKDILLGFHPHNNLQNAYANAITFITNAKEERSIVVDSSILGMGRGAGNLPTELIVEYLNKNYDKNYDILPLLDVTDEIIGKIKEENDWGYSLPYYLSAINACHPSYIIHFLERKTISAADINNLIQRIRLDKKTEYDKSYAEEIYRVYNSVPIDDTEAKKKLNNLIDGKELVLIGPGKSIVDYKDQIEDKLNSSNIFSISINSFDMFDTDAVFFSNKKRYEAATKKDKKNKLLFLTSNIKSKPEEDSLIFDYEGALTKGKSISDSSLLMLLNIIKEQSPKEITLIGFDGFSTEKDNFYNKRSGYTLNEEYIKSLNDTIKNAINAYKEEVKIKFLTPSKYMEESRR